MPRILPRLLAQIERTAEQQSSWTPFVLPRRRPKSLHKPVPPRPSFHPVHYAKSILLGSPGTNPITSSRVYLRHKSLPPRPRLSRRVKTRKDCHDHPRAMTEQERQWWSSPYLRMLASPIRQCVATERFMPNDFLIRLAHMHLPASLLPAGERTSTPAQVVLPDGLQHSKFTVRKSDKANYILCNRAALTILTEYRAKRLSPTGASIHPHLADQIAHLLRLRVLQELELLADQLQADLDRPGRRPKYKSRIIRRLTRDEWDALRSDGTIPYPGAIAVLVVPPLQKDPITKQRPEPSMSAAPPKPEDVTTPKSAIPMCTLHPVAPAAWDPALGDGILPEERVPLYNGVALFPARSQRAALHALLTRLLGIERRSRHAGAEPAQCARASHAFLLCSDTESVLRGDVAAVAIALWRVRMFEDTGEDVASQRTAGWERTRR
ncbi:hypothetical protein LshimejAT787_0105380 [Lyophyllum shimeji]|uniref:Uncharacterized protein n=1 Tax=Lyophyllum shimeji TaxID=47721 RepID=A0A9P3UHC3_LYOSH|nr:hypothetical protein LshimejAT787_0105380 [Lyophyllum shimeji]